MASGMSLGFGMTLKAFLIISASLHALVLATAFMSPVVEQEQPRHDGWEQVALKPVTLQVIATPKTEPKPEAPPVVEPAPVEAPEPELEQPPQAPPEPKPAPTRHREPVAKAKPQAAPPANNPPKDEQDKPVAAAATKLAVSVVTTSDPEEQKHVAQQAKQDTEAKEASGAVAANHMNLSAPTGPTSHHGRVDGLSSGKDAGVGAAERQHSGIDEDGLLRGYRKSIFLAINQKKTYPLVARRLKLEGKVFIEVEIDAAGKILNARVERSSGNELLDKEALKSLLAMRHLPSPPSQLKPKSRRLTIPLIYRLGMT